MRPSLRISLLGKFAVHLAGEEQLNQIPHKPQELLAYLVLHQGKTHPRDTLAELLWGRCDTPNSRKYLRQSLWQLHAGLVSLGRSRAAHMLHGNADWLELTLDERMEIDAIEFESGFNALRTVRGEDLSREQARGLVSFSRLYRGDLLEGWSAEWCFYDRERYRRMYLAILDKLADHFEARHEHDAVIAYATLALKQDPARERAHRSMMRGLAKSGDRSGALRQYERCIECLRDDLGVEPEPETVVLEGLIREGKIIAVLRERVAPSRNGQPSSATLAVVVAKSSRVAGPRRAEG